MTQASCSSPFSFLSSECWAHTKTGRLILLGPDLLRFLSVIAIVWLHSQAPGQKYLDASIYSLILLSVILPTIGTSCRDFKEFVIHRAKRLLIPYAFFWLFYGMLAVLRGKPIFPSPWIIIEGHNVHLWYLPYAFFASVLVAPLNMLLSKAPARFANVFLLGLSIAVFIGISVLIEHFTYLSRVPSLYLRFAPTIPLGVLIGRVVRNGNHKSSISWLAALTVITAVTTELLQLFGLIDLTLPYCIALVLVSSSLLWQQGTTKAILKITSLSMAIYLLHPAVAFVLLRLGVPGLDNFGPLLTFTLIFTTIPVAWFAQQTPLRRLL